MDSPRELAAMLRKKHQERDCPEGAFCEGNCYQPCICGDRWPCPKKAETDAIAAALERGADAIEVLEKRGHADGCNFYMRWKEIGGYVCDCGWDAMFPGVQERRDREAVAASAVEGSNQSA